MICCYPNIGEERFALMLEALAKMWRNVDDKTKLSAQTLEDEAHGRHSIFLY